MTSSSACVSSHSLNARTAGPVWVNNYNVTPPEVPFGGYKQSGLGRGNGLQAIEHFMQVKTVYVNLGDVPETFQNTWVGPTHVVTTGIF